MRLVAKVSQTPPLVDIEAQIADPALELQDLSHARSKQHAPSALEQLPTELLLLIDSFLPPLSSLCLVFSSPVLLHALGHPQEHLNVYQERMKRQTASFLYCWICDAMHPVPTRPSIYDYEHAMLDTSDMGRVGSAHIPAWITDLATEVYWGRGPMKDGDTILELETPCPEGVSVQIKICAVKGRIILREQTHVVVMRDRGVLTGVPSSVDSALYRIPACRGHWVSKDISTNDLQCERRLELVYIPGVVPSLATRQGAQLPLPYLMADTKWVDLKPVSPPSSEQPRSSQWSA
ncbi:hypothetical protein LTS18_006137, partial [Coniosporium uncinatum]